VPLLSFILHFSAFNMFKPLIRFSGKQLAAAARPVAVRTYAAAAAATAYQWNDPLGSHNLLTEEELAVSETAESYCQEQLMPRVLGKFCNSLKPGVRV
jgi:glutaryl-CoA dehydrogenase